MSKPFLGASKKHPCLVCSRQSWPCYRRPDESAAWCKTVYSEKTDKDGLYLHVFRWDESRPRLTLVQTSPPRPSTAPPDHLHLVYSSLLSHLHLFAHRRDRLLARGLAPHSIEEHGYRDTPTKEERAALVSRLEPLGLKGVPGFFVRDGRWRIVGCYPGHLVPYRDVMGRIRGLSYRLDVPIDKAKYIWLSSDPEATFDDGARKYPAGTKLTPPLHFARPELIASSSDILLTEGALKSDVAAQLLGLPFIAAGGVTQWGDGFAETFRKRFPDKRAVICYDSDWRTNKDVRHALERLMARLGEAGVTYVVRSWPQYPEAKGIDDLALALSHQSREVAAA